MASSTTAVMAVAPLSVMWRRARLATGTMANRATGWAAAFPPDSKRPTSATMPTNSAVSSAYQSGRVSHHEVDPSPAAGRRPRGMTMTDAIDQCGEVPEVDGHDAQVDERDGHPYLGLLQPALRVRFNRSHLKRTELLESVDATDAAVRTRRR